jgi:hypothetical protein
MAANKGEVYTAGKIAESLGVPPAKVKKLLEEIKIQPVQVKGACKYYDKSALEQLQVALKGE